MTVCNQCILSDEKQDVCFDASGICNICQEYNLRAVPFDYIDFSTFSEKLQSYQNTNGRYDCLVLFTGGKDSVYLLDLLSKVPNFRILAVTIDCWFTSPQTWTNIERILKKVHVDHLIFRPAWAMSQALYRATVLVNGELCMPCEAFITTEAYRLAVEMNVPTIAWGLNPSQFNTPPDWILKTDLDYWQKIYDRFIKSMGIAIGLDTEIYKSFTDQYVPHLEKYEDRMPRHIFPYLALGYDPAFVENYVNNMGWTRPTDVAGVGSNCCANNLHTYLKRAFYSKESLESYLALQVRLGAISREHALHVLEHDVPEELANAILDELNIDTSASILIRNLALIRRCMC